MKPTDLSPGRYALIALKSGKLSLVDGKTYATEADAEAGAETELRSPGGPEDVFVVRIGYRFWIDPTPPIRTNADRAEGA